MRARTNTILTIILLFAAAQTSLAGDDAYGGRVLIVAAPQASRFTGWSRNWCHGGVPQSGAGFACSDGGLSVGGEIYKVKLSNVQVIIGHLSRSVAYVALPQHALSLSAFNRRMWLLVLEPASADFAEKTGLTYIASDDGAFDPSVACLQLRSIGEAFGIAEVPTSSSLGGQNCYTLDTILGLSKRASQ
jgi:hypothetical protein